MNIGEVIKNAREDKDFTQQKMAELIPMHQTAYSKIERNIQEPNLYQLKRICQILNLSADRLLKLNQFADITEKDIKMIKDIKNFINEYKES